MQHKNNDYVLASFQNNSNYRLNIHYSINAISMMQYGFGYDHLLGTMQMMLTSTVLDLWSGILIHIPTFCKLKFAFNEWKI